MFARVTMNQAPGGNVEEITRIVNEMILPRAQQQEGFQGGYWLLERQSGKFIGVVLWDTEEHLEAAAQFQAANQGPVLQAMQAAGMSGPPTFEAYEVLAKA